MTEKKTKMLVVSEEVHGMIFDRCPKKVSVSDFLKSLLEENQ